jgi:hypothetical protein
MNKINAFFCTTLCFAVSLHAACALAKEYKCPERMDVTHAETAPVAGFELWKDPQAKVILENISLYDGHPREMAPLKPDNGDDLKARTSLWTLFDNPRGFWMVCQYANTDIRWIKRLDNPKKSCATQEKKSQIVSLKCE